MIALHYALAFGVFDSNAIHLYGPGLSNKYTKRPLRGIKRDTSEWDSKGFASATYAAISYSFSSTYESTMYDLLAYLDHPGHVRMSSYTVHLLPQRMSLTLCHSNGYTRILPPNRFGRTSAVFADPSS